MAPPDVNNSNTRRKLRKISRSVNKSLKFSCLQCERFPPAPYVGSSSRLVALRHFAACAAGGHAFSQRNNSPNTDLMIDRIFSGTNGSSQRSRNFLHVKILVTELQTRNPVFSARFWSQVYIVDSLVDGRLDPINFTGSPSSQLSTARVSLKWQMAIAA